MDTTPATISPRVLELLRFTETHQRHTEALAKATGEHFNIFQILGIGRLEVATHSPMLAEFLNPKGHHGQGAAFLRLFIEQFDIHNFEAESDTATMKLEYHVGPVTEKSGGRIDIVVKDGKGGIILIENKIGAGDQDNQMKRYREFDPKAHLFYLTLDGREPSNLSEDELNQIQCRCISYAGEILGWLKECRKTAVCLPNVRETVSQYIHLIEELTNQSTTILMNEELIQEIVKSPESLRAFYTLRGAESAVQTELITRLDAKLDDLAKAIGVQREGPLRDLHIKYAGFYFKTPSLEKNNLQIGCTFDKGYYGDFCFGFAKQDHTKGCPIEAQILSAFKESFPSQSQAPTAHWPAWAYWDEPYKYWRQEAFEAIRNGKFAEDLKAKIETLAKIARQVCPAESQTS
jgi:hypothetical protein